MRAIRITQANWLNDQVGGDRGTVKLVADAMAYEAVEVHKIAEYAPEYDGPASDVLIVKAHPDPVPGKPEVIEFPAGEEFKEAVADFKEKVDDLLRKPDDDPAALPGSAPGEPEVKQPWTTASKAAWIDWALSGDHGQPRPARELAAAMTKNELMSKYGERL